MRKLIRSVDTQNHIGIGTVPMSLLEKGHKLSCKLFYLRLENGNCFFISCPSSNRVCLGFCPFSCTGLFLWVFFVGVAPDTRSVCYFAFVFCLSRVLVVCFCLEVASCKPQAASSAVSLLRCRRWSMSGVSLVVITWTSSFSLHSSLLVFLLLCLLIIRFGFHFPVCFFTSLFA